MKRDIVQRLLTCYGVNGSSIYTMKLTTIGKRYKIHISWHGGCWTAGCLLVHKLAGAKHLWGPLIIIPSQQFCHMHGRPAASRAIRDSAFRKTGPEKGALWRAEYRAVKRDVRKQVDPWTVDAGKTRGAEPFHLHFLQ
uniref:Uncharacterized protein n=1 Tax=Setaria viridis TaxID=4556 RepID=A0A4U6VV42_SETVI|nr:hypothetical protein SEVIR_2G264650v2 [Setaria viridis]